MQSRLIGAGLAALVLSAMWAGARVVRDRSMSKNFAAVSDGMTQDQVLHFMGRPWKTGDCRGKFAPYHLDECAETYVYASAWAPLNPEYPVIWFGRDKLAIGKFNFASP